MKRLIIISILLLTTISGLAQKVDTLYYDGDWKGVPHKAFAEYYRIALYPDNPSTKKMFRNFFMDGTLQGKGEFISIDAEDDSKSIFDGVIETYYKNGKTFSRRTLDKGILNGEFTQYFEDGLIHSTSTFKEGKIIGLYTEFNEDGSYYQIEYDNNGEPANDYYVYANPDGQIIKLKLSDKTPYWESPAISERQKMYKDGVNWLYYVKNGVTVAETCTTVNDYGKWHKIDIIISNESLVPIEFDPNECISAFSIDLSQKPSNLAVWSSEDYIKKVNRAQIWTAIAVGLGEGLATANAGYSTSTTTTTSTYGGTVSAYGNSSLYGSASAYGSGGYAIGTYSGNSTYSGYGAYSGYGTTTSTKRSYDAAAAYQARVLSQQRMADFSEAQWQEKHAKEVGYLKKNTIYPGETISGYVNIQRIDGAAMFNTIYINDAAYKFAWPFGKDGAVITIHEDIDYLANYANIQMDALDPLFESNNKQLHQKVFAFLTWFSQSDIIDLTSVSRVWALENKYFDYQLAQVDALVESNKISKAEYLLGDVQEVYNILPIPIDNLEERLKIYYEKLTPKQRKTFEDGIYSK